MHRLSLIMSFAGLLISASCSQQKPTSPYPQNPAVSDVQGHPRDSTTFYFPAAASLHATDSMQISQPEKHAQMENCRYQFQAASCNLQFFGAPTLSNYYLGIETYRFLWLRSFHRPVLLTLQQSASGGILRTQLLSKPACGLKMTTMLFIPPAASAAQVEKLRKQFKAQQADPKIQRELVEQNRPPKQLQARETSRPVTQQQWQQFKQLLTQSEFRQLTPCESSSSIIDGAYWILESHQTSGYHMVFRHSPNKSAPFRKACEYLIDLSSVRREKRY